MSFIKYIWRISVLAVVAAGCINHLATIAAAGGPENAVVVINGDSPSSKMIANHYVALRSIPPSNLIYLNGIPGKESITLDQFRDLILMPVLNAIKERGLEPQIDYIIYSSDFPTAVKVGDHLKQLTEEAEAFATPINRKIFLPVASINSLTYFSQAVIDDSPYYMTLESNSYYRHPASLILERPFRGELQIGYQRVVLAMDSDDEVVLQKALNTFLVLAKANPRQAAVAYRVAQCLGKLGKASDAATWLGRAGKLGWHFRSEVKKDPAFEKVKQDLLFQAMLERIPDEPFEFVPTMGFRRGLPIGPNGMVNHVKGHGNRHYLSTVLAVTRNYGNSEVDALSQLKRTVAADGTDPKGTFYFTTTKDVRTRTRKPNFDVAIDALERLGYPARVVSAKLPENARDVLGVTIGAPGFGWLASGSRFVPGAIGDNLTSFGGRMEYQGQTKLTEFLAHGAAGASGTVVEPYALQAKFPHPMIHAHYAKGCTLAEAFYQSVHGPMQLLIVGDALCRPFGRVPDFGVTGVQPGSEVSKTVKFEFVPSESSIPIGGYHLFIDGKLVHAQVGNKAMVIDTNSLADGHHEFRIVATANNLLMSTAGVIIPVRVNNDGHQVTLSTESKRNFITDTISFNAKSNVGDGIALVHNGRMLAQGKGREMTFAIEATLLGRGPITVEAIAVGDAADADFQPVASDPLTVTVTGPLAKRKKYENPPKKKKPVVIAPRTKPSVVANPNIQLPVPPGRPPRR